jgi:hypothetical protein
LIPFMCARPVHDLHLQFLTSQLPSSSPCCFRFHRRRPYTDFSMSCNVVSSYHLVWPRRLHECMMEDPKIYIGIACAYVPMADGTPPAAAGPPERELEFATGRRGGRKRNSGPLGRAHAAVPYVVDEGMLERRRRSWGIGGHTAGGGTRRQAHMAAAPSVWGGGGGAPGQNNVTCVHENLTPPPTRENSS